MAHQARLDEREKAQDARGTTQDARDEAQNAHDIVAELAYAREGRLCRRYSAGL